MFQRRNTARASALASLLLFELLAPNPPKRRIKHGFSRYRVIVCNLVQRSRRIRRAAFAVPQIHND